MSGSDIDRNAPLRLARAVELAFPEGGMTVSGLRREIIRGRLEAESIAGKTFVTLAGIERMRELCRVRRTPAASPHNVTANAEVAYAACMLKAQEMKKRFAPKPKAPFTTPCAKATVRRQT